MFKKEREILQRISEELSADQRILKIIAYGSRIRGDYRGDSDLDVLVIVDRKDKEIRDEILDAFYPYELEADIPFSVTILSIEELKINEKLGSPFVESIKKEGVVLYDAEPGGEEGTFKVSPGEGRKAA